MAQTDMLRRYLDAGLAFTKMTQERAEEIVRDLVRAGEVGAEQASGAVEDIVTRSRENTERLFDSVRTEIRDQISNLGLATSDDLAALRAEIAALRSSPAGGGSSGTAPARKASATRAAARKAPGAAVELPATKAPASTTTAPAKVAPAKASDAPTTKKASRTKKASATTKASGTKKASTTKKAAATKAARAKRA